MPYLFCFLFLLLQSHPARAQERLLGKLTDGTDVVFTGSATVGLQLRREGKVVWQQTQPLIVEERTTAGTANDSSLTTESAYSRLRLIGSRALASGTVRSRLNPGVRYHITDTYQLDGDQLHIARRLIVHGNGKTEEGFVSVYRLESPGPVNRVDSHLFLPGTVYGTTDNLQPTAIGGEKTYTEGGGLLQIREDRLPAPLADVSLSDGSFLTVLNSHPDGQTTTADSEDFCSFQQTAGAQPPQLSPKIVIDERFRFGALRVHHTSAALGLGYVFPGSEGEVTYRGLVYPLAGERYWRWRLHPLKAGLVQQYDLLFRLGSSGGLTPAHRTNTWRWAGQQLKPQVVHHDILVIRDLLVNFLVKRIGQAPDGRWGFPYLVDGFANYKYIMPDAVMGFCGKNIEAAYYLIEEAERTGKAQYRELGEKVIRSFVPIPMNPPAAEGFDLLTGKPMVTMYLEGNNIYLRPLTDDFKQLANLLLAERKRHHQHPDWQAWATSFADWLLTQQHPSGGLPRKWEPVTGRVVDDSPQSSYNAIPFLVKMSQLTADPQYVAAASRIGDFSWQSGHERGVFVGGTIDNPNVIDKEAGTLATEGYLALYESTSDNRWLDRARAAADFAETWIYLWNVPMPVDADPRRLSVKPGVPSTGFQLISTGHSLADAYMSFDVDEYAKLYCYTGDAHYRTIAQLLLHNTKSLLALPVHRYDLPDLGYQQEHVGFGPARGQGIHRLWLPWVTTSHLNGIIGLEQFDKDLFNELIR